MERFQIKRVIVEQAPEGFTVGEDCQVLDSGRVMFWDIRTGETVTLPASACFIMGWGFCYAEAEAVREELTRQAVARRWASAMHSQYHGVATQQELQEEADNLASVLEEASDADIAGLVDSLFCDGAAYASEGDGVRISWEVRSVNGMWTTQSAVYTSDRQVRVVQREWNGKAMMATAVITEAGSRRFAMAVETWLATDLARFQRP